MKKFLRTKQALAASLLAGGCASSWALSLGAPAGQAWIGQPLQISAPVDFGSEDPADECVHAEVFYGEARVPTGQVSAIVTGPPQQRRVRVESRALVNEPIVTLSLRAGCGSPVTRNDTLLADLPTEEMIAASYRPPAPEAETIIPSTPPRPPLNPLEPSVAPVAPVPAKAARPLAPASRKPTAHPRVLKVARPVVLPKLKLDAIEIELPVAPLPSPVASAPGSGAAAMQAVPGSDSEQASQPAEKLRQMEGEITLLQRSLKEAKTNVEELRYVINQPPPWYLSPAFVLVLALTALIGTTSTGVLLLHRRLVRPEGAGRPSGA